MVRLVIAVLAALLLAPPTFAQESVDRDAIERIRAESRRGDRSVEAYDHLTNAVGPRLTNSPAFHEAVDWAESTLRAWGIPRVEREGWEFGPGWTLEKLTLEMVEPRYFPLVGYPVGWSASTDGVLEGEAVYVGDWTPDEIRSRADELRGRIVLATGPQPGFILEDRPQPTLHDGPVEIGAPDDPDPVRPAGRRELGALMEEVGAGAVLRPSAGAHGTLFVTGGGDRSPGGVAEIVVSGEHYNLLVRAVREERPVRLRVGVAARFHDEETAYNVLAEIPGSDPEVGDQVVMAGAHLDSWHAATGGTDNADGVATVMEAIRILHALDEGPRRTVRVALWGGEEQGLHGSREWVSRHLEGEANRDARERFSVYFNQDIGYGPIYGIYAAGNQAALEIFDTWLGALDDVEPAPRRSVIERIGSSDHVPFARAGVPGFSTIQSYAYYDTRTHHTNADFFERVSEEGLRQSAVTLATLLLHAAQREERIPR